jgi:hypothetical protein
MALVVNDEFEDAAVAQATYSRLRGSRLEHPATRQTTDRRVPLGSKRITTTEALGWCISVVAAKRARNIASGKVRNDGVKFAAFAGALLLLAACSAPLAKGEADDRIVYKPVGIARGTPPQCSEPYSLTVFSSGRVRYEGRDDCAREVGVREISIPRELAESWIQRLAKAGFLEFQYQKPRIADTQQYELELAVGNRSNKIRFADGDFAYARAAWDVVSEIRTQIDPYKRWTCRRGTVGC